MAAVRAHCPSLGMGDHVDADVSAAVCGSDQQSGSRRAEALRCFAPGNAKRAWQCLARMCGVGMLHAKTIPGHVGADQRRVDVHQLAPGDPRTDARRHRSSDDPADGLAAEEWRLEIRALRCECRVRWARPDMNLKQRAGADARMRALTIVEYLYVLERRQLGLIGVWKRA
jgi:hypothetical protein